MLNATEIKKMKQVNISKAPEKTRTRIKEVYEASKRGEKQTIIELSGQNRNSFYRAERTGNASAKIIVPLAQVANVSPYWLIGASDEKEELTPDMLAEFLTEMGYPELASIAKPAVVKKTRKPRTPKADKQAVEQPEAETVEETVALPVEEPVEQPVSKKDPAVNVLTLTISNTPKMREAVETLDLDSATQLLAALYLRSKAGGEAQQLCEAVKYCLLS